MRTVGVCPYWTLSEEMGFPDSLLCISECICVSAHMYMSCVCVCASDYGDQSQVLGISLYYAPPLIVLDGFSFWSQRSLIGYTVWPGHPRDFPIYSASLSWKYQPYKSMRAKVTPCSLLNQGSADSRSSRLTALKKAM